MSQRRRFTLLAIGMCAVLLVAVGAAVAQQTTYEIKSGEVLQVSGNTLVVRGPNGVREILVAEDFRFDMDGKQLSVHELKPGMTLTALITTTSTPVEMTTTEVRNAEVIHTIGNSIVVRNTEDGKYRKFTTDQINDLGIIIYRNGKIVPASSLKKGDRVSATFYTKLPPVIMTDQDIQVLAENAPPPPPKSQPGSALAPAAAPAPPPALPKTGSPLPLIGLAGALSLAGGMALALRRRLAGR
jgi:LPXTG-motif cell wall-anchored protein